MPNPVFSPSSPLSQSIANLFILILAIGGAILLLVMGLVFYSAYKFRARPGQPEPKQDFGRLHLEISWTAAPLLLVLGLLGYSIVVMGVSDPVVSAGEDPPDVTIIGHQWWWEVKYPSSGVVTANEIHIPANKRLLFAVESADVIHDFWVPALGRKMDAIPGRTNYTWQEAIKPGTYLGTCAEFCGLQHAWMRIRVIAQTQEEFDAWVQQQLAVPSIPSSGEAATGQQLFRELTCVNCHVINTVGPNLTHFGSRETLGAGVLTNTPENLAKWLADPQAVKPGIHMPDLNLSQEEINALVAYLEASK